MITLMPQRASDEFERMRDEMERMMNEFFVAKNPMLGVSEGVWRPPTDVYEMPEAMVILMEIAGMKKEDIHVDVQDKRLVIHGVRSDRTRKDKVKFIQMEIKYTRFERVIPLPIHFDESQIAANYRGGFLEIVIPRKRRDDVPTRSININLFES